MIRAASERYERGKRHYKEKMKEIIYMRFQLAAFVFMFNNDEWISHLTVVVKFKIEYLNFAHLMCVCV